MVNCWLSFFGTTIESLALLRRSYGESVLLRKEMEVNQYVKV